MNLKLESAPIPDRVPRLESIEALYFPEELEAQRRRYAALESSFFDRFPENRGGQPPLFFSAPGRTELCGNHTDHNRGEVLAAAISLDTAAAAAPRRDSRARIVSEGFGAIEVDLGDLSPRADESGGSAAIVRGMAAGIAARRGASPLRGFDAYIQSSVPPGSGLSSSAAFEVLVGAMLCVFSGIDASPSDIAKIGQFAENEYFGKPSGLMDQMACALGSVAAIDFGDPAKPVVELLDFDPAVHGLTLAIVAAGGSHADLTDDYASIPAEMKSVAALFGRPALAGIEEAELVAAAPKIRASCGDRAFLRALHFARETRRPQAMRDAILKKDVPAYLAAVKASGDSSAKYLQNLFSPKAPREQGLLVALALTEGFLAGEGACRVHGGGFAGTIQAYIPAARLPAYVSLMESAFGNSCVFPLRIRPRGVVYIDRKGAQDER